MPRLSCDVRNCSNNKDRQCSLSYIAVDGDNGGNATNPADTCCSNFTASAVVASNSPHHPQEEVKVKCAASGCIYNDYYNCILPDIQISGSTTTTSSHETECASFVCR